MRISDDVSKIAHIPPKLFASAQWAGVYPDGILPRAVVSGNRPSAALNLYQYRKLGKTVLIHPPFAPDCGLTIAPGSAKRYSIQTETKRIMRTLAAELNTAFDGAYIDVAFPPEVVDIQPFLETGFTAAVGYTYRLALHESADHLLAGFSTERRKNIRDARRIGSTVKFDTDPEAVIDLTQNTLGAAGLHHDFRILRGILQLDDSFSVSVWRQDVMLATAVIAFDKDCAWYVAGGTRKDADTSGAGALALWSAIRHAADQGIATFDFCGSSVPAIEKFFRGFGGELTPYFRVRKNNRLFDMLKNTKDKIASL